MGQAPGQLLEGWEWPGRGRLRRDRAGIVESVQYVGYFPSLGILLASLGSWLPILQPDLGSLNAYLLLGDRMLVWFAERSTLWSLPASSGGRVHLSSGAVCALSL